MRRTGLCIGGNFLHFSKTLFQMSHVTPLLSVPVFSEQFPKPKNHYTLSAQGQMVSETVREDDAVAWGHLSALMSLPWGPGRLL